MFANEALTILMDMDWDRCLDIGSGPGDHAYHLKDRGHVVTLDKHHPAEINKDYMFWKFYARFQAIWCSHVLEHQVDPGAFLQKIFSDLAVNGIAAITVPPSKPQIVGGHVTIWNQGLLAYNMILAGFDMRDAQIWQYGYNISAIVRKRHFHMPHLHNDSGDIIRLSPYFPKDWDIFEGFDGNNPEKLPTESE